MALGEQGRSEPKGNLRSRSYVDRKLPLSKPNLHQVEEVTAQEVSPDVVGAEADFQDKRPQHRMGENNAMDSCLHGITMGRSVAKDWPAQEINPDRMCGPSIEQGAPRARVQVC